VLAWGLDDHGQCDVPALPAGVTCLELAAGTWHSLARLSDGSILAWGDNWAGQRNVPPLPAGVEYVEVDAGTFHSVARRSDGALVAWGSNTYGQCDVPEVPRGVAWLEVAAGARHTLARYGSACEDQVTYCTAKPNSLGCVPAIALSGPLSADAGARCMLSAENLMPDAVGLFLHSTSGAASTPFHGGWLCLAPPLWRHPAQNSGGSAGSCSGVLAEDISSYIAGGTDPALVAGAQVWLQCWSRDPDDPFGDNTSDAVTATICP